MLSCGGDVVTTNDVGTANDICCGCGAISLVEIGVSSLISSGCGGVMSHERPAMSILLSISPPDHVTITHHNSCDAPDHMSDILSSLSDRVISVPDCDIVSDNIGSASHHNRLSDMVSGEDNGHISCFDTTSPQSSSSHDHHMVGITSSDKTMFDIV